MTASSRTSWSRGLQLGGYECTVAGSGDQALWAVLGRHPDVIVLDVMIPHPSGIEVCRHLRQIGWDGFIVIVSARSNAGDVEAATRGCGPVPGEALWDGRAARHRRRPRRPVGLTLVSSPRGESRGYEGRSPRDRTSPCTTPARPCAGPKPVQRRLGVRLRDRRGRADRLLAAAQLRSAALPVEFRAGDVCAIDDQGAATSGLTTGPAPVIAWRRAHRVVAAVDDGDPVRGRSRRRRRRRHVRVRLPCRGSQSPDRVDHRAGTGLTPAEIDAEVRARVSAGEDLYTLDEARARATSTPMWSSPRISARCARSTSPTSIRRSTIWDARAEVVTVDPMTLDEVIESVLTLGKITGNEHRATELVAGLASSPRSVPLPRSRVVPAAGRRCWNGPIRPSPRAIGCPTWW